MKLEQLTYVLFFTTFCFSLSAQSQTVDSEGKYRIHGLTIPLIDEVKLLHYEDGKLKSLDSVKLEDGLFTFEGQISAPEVYYLEFDAKVKLPIFMENSMIDVRIEGLSSDSSFISGSSVHSEWVKIKHEIQKYDIQLDTIRNKYYRAKSEGNESFKEKLSNEYDTVELVKEAVIDSLILNNTKSYISPYLVIKYKMHSGDPNELEAYMSGFDTSIINSPYIDIIDRRIEKLNLTKVGDTIPSFTLPDTSGRLVHIEEFRGKFVLIDFWASWCGPCRQENPNIVAAYNEFQNKGFTVVGISLDKERKAWLNAVNKDGLTWSQLSDLKGWNNEIAEMFGVRSIPFSILIDPNGIVVVKELLGEDLHLELNKQMSK